MKIVLATRNKGKLIEFHKMLTVPGIEYISAEECGAPDVEETGTTYFENAMLKACSAADHTGLSAIADDSGMELRAFNGFPGIESARCAGIGATGAECQEFILKKMSGVEDRAVRFISLVAMVGPLIHHTRKTTWFVGSCEGILTDKVIGESKPGLMYDSIFFSPELGCTFAEAGERKHTVSHRWHAFEQMKQHLEDIVGKGQ
jgi:XTP/dITP diphosphohydrolase